MCRRLSALCLLNPAQVAFRTSFKGRNLAVEMSDSDESPYSGSESEVRDCAKAFCETPLA